MASQGRGCFASTTPGEPGVSGVRGAVFTSTHGTTARRPAGIPGEFMRRNRHFSSWTAAPAWLTGALLLLAAPAAYASEAELVIPDLGSVDFLGVNGRSLLFGGILVCMLGL